jgi:hypothetical protein
MRLNFAEIVCVVMPSSIHVDDGSFVDDGSSSDGSVDDPGGDAVIGDDANGDDDNGDHGPRPRSHRTVELDDPRDRPAAAVLPPLERPSRAGGGVVSPRCAHALPGTV